MQEQIIEVIKKFLGKVEIKSVSQEEETPYLIQQMYNEIGEIIKTNNNKSA